MKKKRVTINKRVDLLKLLIVFIILLAFLIIGSLIYKTYYVFETSPPSSCSGNYYNRLIYYYPFDLDNVVDNTQIVDLGFLGDGNGIFYSNNDKKVNKAVAGILGKAIRFDGIDDKIVIPSEDYNNYGASISLWVRPEKEIQITYPILLKTNNNALTGYTKGYHLIIWNGEVCYGARTLLNDFEICGGKLALNQWNHIVVTFSTKEGHNIDKVKLFINGKQVNEEPALNWEGTTNNNPVIIGVPSLSAGFNMSIDEVIFLKSVITDSEISKLYNDGKGFDVCNNLILPISYVIKEKIIDNRDPEFSNSSSWVVSVAPNYYGTDSLYTGSYGSKATWNFDGLKEGGYVIYGWWTYYAYKQERFDKVPYYIYENDVLKDVVRVDQSNTDLAGKWNFFGGYNIKEGSNLTVVLICENEINTTCSADAIKITWLEEVASPVCEDNDKDGYGKNCVLGDDCNDNDENVHSILTCDADGKSCGKFELCVAQCPTEPKKNYYVDKDKDTYGAGEPKISCTPLEEYVTNNLDCNDTNPSLNVLKQCDYNGKSCGKFELCVAQCPSVPPEICENKIDEDCDGKDLVCPTDLPTLNVEKPENNSKYLNVMVPLKFEAEDAINCWYVLDDKPINSSCRVDTTLALDSGDHIISVYANNSHGLIKEVRNLFYNKTRKYIVIYNKFKGYGMTTDLDTKTDLELQNLSLSLNTPGGKIDFISNINLTKNADSKDVIDIDSNVNISYNRVEVKAEVLSALDVPARITLYNLSLTNPIILRDGLKCDYCKIESSRNQILVFVVPDFSVYSAKSSGQEPTKSDKKCIEIGGIICNSEEKCEGTVVESFEGECCIGKCVKPVPSVKRISISKTKVNKATINKNEEVVFIVGNNEYNSRIDMEEIILIIDDEEYALQLNKIVKVKFGSQYGYVAMTKLKDDYIELLSSLDRSVLAEQIGEKGFPWQIVIVIVLIASIIGVAFAIYLVLRKNNEEESPKFSQKSTFRIKRKSHQEF